jgi:hypothetical protein
MATAGNTITEKQGEFIKRLATERDLTVEHENLLKVGRKRWTQNRLTKELASEIITELMRCPVKEQPAPAPEVSLEGMHRVGEEIYKVQRAVHGSGHLYAKRLTKTEFKFDMQHGKTSDDGWKFEYAPGAMRLLSTDTKMTLEQAKEWGALYGTCCVCGRTLTNEESIEAGIGPVCAGKF